MHFRDRSGAGHPGCPETLRLARDQVALMEPIHSRATSLKRRLSPASPTRTAPKTGPGNRQRRRQRQCALSPPSARTPPQASESGGVGVAGRRGPSSSRRRSDAAAGRPRSGRLALQQALEQVHLLDAERPVLRWHRVEQLVNGPGLRVPAQAALGFPMAARLHGVRRPPLGEQVVAGPAVPELVQACARDAQGGHNTAEGRCHAWAARREEGGGRRLAPRMRLQHRPQPGGLVQQHRLVRGAGLGQDPGRAHRLGRCQDDRPVAQRPRPPRWGQQLPDRQLSESPRANVGVEQNRDLQRLVVQPQGQQHRHRCRHELLWC
eukprot:5313612-Pyramimonas_sp.AAC.2